MTATIGYATLSIIPSFSGFQSNLQRGLGSANTGQMGEEAGNRFTSGMKKAMVGLGGVFAASKAFDYLSGAVSAGSELNETMSKAQTIFGSAFGELDKWADGAAGALGQSKEQALGAASTFGNLFDQLGVGEELSAGMSTKLVGLASDFASFHNADISQVLDAQTAAFRGEFDALQRYVPTINAAAVEQKALEQTGKKTTKELTAQEKALATNALLFEGAGEAAGDFGRTSEGLANQQRILGANMDNLKARIGQGLVPIMEAATGFVLNSVIPAFERWGPKVTEVVQSISAVVSDYWPQIQSVISGVLDTVRDVIEGFVSVASTLWANFGDNIMSYVQRVWPPIQQVISGVMETIQGVIQTITAAISGDWGEAWEGVKQVFGGVWDTIQGLVKTAFEQLRLAIDIGLETIGSIIRGAWDGIVDFIGGIPERLATAGKGMFDFLKEAFRDAVNFIIDGWNGLEFKVPGFKVGPVGYDGFTLGVPDIPRLAKGGFVTAGQPYIVGDGGRPELFIPNRDGAVLPYVPDYGGTEGRGGDMSYVINVTQVPGEDPATTAFRELRRIRFLMG